MQQEAVSSDEGSNNPALTVPAAAGIRPTRSRSDGNDRATVLPADSSETNAKSADFLKYNYGWRRVIRNLSPSWFSVTMGTGVVSLLLITIPFKAAWLYWLAVIFFVLNSILFTAAFSASFLRYTLYPKIWTVMIADSTNSLFLGTIPMGFATLIESWIFLCVPYWGPWSITFAWICWIIDSIVAVGVTISMTVLLISASQEQALHRITALQLLPIAATIVAAGAGSEIAPILLRDDTAINTIIASYVMWAMSTPLAMAVLVMYYQRLALFRLPPREIIVSSFLPLGPLGMGGYTIMNLGSACRELFPRTHFLYKADLAGEIFYIMGVFIALVMWGFGLTWLCFALASIYRSRPFPFNMGWWGFTFPLGVFAINTIQLGIEMSSMFFKVLGTIFSAAVIVLWVVVAIGTIKGTLNGKLLNAPCLANLPKQTPSEEYREAQLEK